MLKKMLRRLITNLGYVSVQDYNAAIYSNVKLQREYSTLSSENKELFVKNQNLSNELELLNDENQSLWDMLDEINGANNFGKDQVKSMMTELEEVLTDEMMKNFKPIAEG